LGRKEAQERAKALTPLSLMRFFAAIPILPHPSRAWRFGKALA